MREVYKATETIELKVLDKSKLFIIDEKYNKDIFIQIYPKYFEEIDDSEVEVVEVIMDCGSSILEEDVHEFDVNKTYIRKEIE